MKLVLALFALLIVSRAQAESFFCQGTGRFSDIPREKITMDGSAKYGSKDILMLSTGRVTLSLDKVNSDGSHYLTIEVVEQNKLTEEFSSRGAKGSVKDLVVFIDNPQALIACVPAK